MTRLWIDTPRTVTGTVAYRKATHAPTGAPGIATNKSGLRRIMQFPVLTPAESLRMRPSRPVLIESRADPLVEHGLIAINKATQQPPMYTPTGPYRKYAAAIRHEVLNIVKTLHCQAQALAATPH